MKIIIPFLLIFVLSTAHAQDLSLYLQKEYKNKIGNTIPYRILFPENYDRNKKYPLVLFLHGRGECGTDNEKQLTHGSKLFLSENARKNFPCIVIFPQCPEESYWASVKVDRSTAPVGLEFDYSRPIMPPLETSIELVKRIMKEEGVDKKRVYITGLSMGGMGTFEAVYRYPKLFAAALPICGGGDFKKYNKREKKIPFWVFHGEADKTVDVKNSRDMVEKLKSIGAKVNYSEYPEVGHNSWDNAFAEPEFLKWMFSQNRK